MFMKRAIRHLGYPARQPGRSLATSTGRISADHVRLVEVGPRDGLQNEKSSIPVETKITLVKRLAATGIQTIEAGSFVSPKWVPQVVLFCRRIACET